MLTEGDLTGGDSVCVSFDEALFKRKFSLLGCISQFHNIISLEGIAHNIEIIGGSFEDRMLSMQILVLKDLSEALMMNVDDLSCKCVDSDLTLIKMLLMILN